MTPADRDFLAGWSFGALVVAAHVKSPAGELDARGAILQAIDSETGRYRHVADSPDNVTGQAEAYLAAWGF